MILHLQIFLVICFFKSTKTTIERPSLTTFCGFSSQGYHTNPTTNLLLTAGASRERRNAAACKYFMMDENMICHLLPIDHAQATL